MKKFFSVASTLFFTFFLFAILVNTSSCKKTVTITLRDTTTITIHDTTTVTDTVAPVVPTATQILKSHTWEVDEVYQIVNGSDTTHYIRGGENTTGSNQSVQRMTFNAGGTGTYIDALGNNYTLAWHFTSADEHNMRIVVTRPGVSMSYDWSLVDIAEDHILQTSAGGNLLLVARWIPVP